MGGQKLGFFEDFMLSGVAAGVSKVGHRINWDRALYRLNLDSSCSN